MSEIAQRSPQQEVIAQIRGEEFREQIAQALPEGISAERFARIAVTALLEDQSKQRDPEKQLLACDRLSLFQALIRCAQSGLLPDGKEAAIVKRGKAAVFQPMVGGFRKIAGEHGWTIRSGAAHEHDEFDFQDEPPMLHHKVFTGGPRGELRFAYAVARHRDGRREQRVMTRDEVLKRQAVATTQKVWEERPDEMWAKTAVRDLFGELPMDPADALRLARVIEADRLARGEAAAELYGPPASEGEAQSETLSAPSHAASEQSQPPAEAPPPPAGAGEPEPGISEPEPAEGEAPLQALADAAAGFVPPSGKFSQGGAHGPKTLREIAALGPDGERWLRWALANVATPPEYVGAIVSFCRVYAPEAYQEHATRQELGL